MTAPLPEEPRTAFAANGEIVESGEGYVRRVDAVAAAERHHPRVSDVEW